jgi:hypothetical protein
MSLISGIIDKIADVVKSVNYGAIAALTKPVITKLVFDAVDKVKSLVTATPNGLDDRLFELISRDVKENWDEWFEAILSAAGLVAVPQEGGNAGEVAYIPTVTGKSRSLSEKKECLIQDHFRFLHDASERTGISVGNLVNIIVQILPVLLRFFSI